MSTSLKPMKLLYITAILIISILILFVSATNIILTGNILGVRETINVGFLGSHDNMAASYRSDQALYGIQMALENSNFWGGEFIINIIKNENEDLMTNLNYFKEKNVKAIFVADISDLFSISEFANNNRFPVFYAYLQPRLENSSELGKYMFALSDYFSFPAILLADAANNLGLKNIGVVYMKDKFDLNDDTREIFSQSFKKISGENISFDAIYYLDNKTGADEIINLISSTNSEAIVLLGHGACNDDNNNLLSKIKEKNPDLKILSLGKYKYMRGFFDDVLLVGKDYLPEIHWKGMLSENFLYAAVRFENANSIHIEENIKDNDALKYLYRQNKSYPFIVEGYIFVEIMKNLISLCSDDTECMRRVIHENTFDTCLGKVRFTENGIIMRPYLLKRIKNEKEEKSFIVQENTVIIKRYNLADLERIKNDYGLEF